MTISLADVAVHVKARLVGDGGRLVRGVAGLDCATPEEITFVANPRYLGRLRTSKAAAAIVADPVESLNIPQLVVDNVDAALVQVLTLFAQKDLICEPGIDPTARIGKDAVLGQGVGIGAYAVIGDGVRIGDGTFVAAGCKVGHNVQIGANCRLYPGSIVHDRCKIGNYVVIQANTVIGSVGFGYTNVNGDPRLVPHIGNVVIEDCVEIGANACVDRAKFGSTRIGAGTKIDNLVQVAHNVAIGRCCLVAGMAGIAGSCRLGDGVVLGGQVGVRDHVTIGDGAMVGGKSFVMQDIGPGEKVFGYPAMEKTTSLRVMHAMRRLPELLKRVARLEAAGGVWESQVAGKVRGARAIRWAAAVFTAGAVVFLACSWMRPWLDPDEVRVEKMVADYQDGDDLFFVSADPGLEDLRTSERVFLVGNVDQVIERAMEEYGDKEDCYFLVPLSSVEKLRGGRLRDRLFLVTEMAIRNSIYALVTTESDRAFMRL